MKKAHWIIRSEGTRVFAIHAEDVENAPTVDAVEVIHGYWGTDRFGLDRSICSVCGACYEGDGGNYCRNCGAKMDGDGNA